jgi:MFS family permease
VKITIATLRIYIIHILFLEGFTRSLVITILPFFFISKFPIWENTNNSLGFAIACYPLGSMFFSTTIGRLSDKIGRNRALCLSSLIVSMSFFLVTIGIILKNKYYFFSGLFLSGSSASTVVVSKSLICDVSSQVKRIFNLSSLEIGAGIGWLMGPLVGSLFYQYAYKSALIKSLPFILCFWLYLTLFLTQYILFYRVKPINSYAKKKHLNKFKCTAMLKYVIFLWISYALATEIFIHLFTTFLLKKHLFSALSAGKLISFMGGFYIFVTLTIVMPTIKNIKRPLLVVTNSVLIQGISTLFVVLSQSTIGLYISTCLFVIGQAYSVPACVALLSSQVTTAHRGKLIGICYSLQSIGILVAGIIVLPMFALSNNLPFFMSSFLYYICFVIALLLIWKSKASYNDLL